jgi:transglutaminase-like putative cysteine protease
MIISIGDVPPMPRSDSPAPIPYYWRSMTYENYNGFGWTNSGAAIAEVLAGKALLESKHADYRLVRQTFRFPSGASGALYWTNTLLRVDVPIHAAWRSRAGPDDPTDIFGEGDLLSASTLSDGYTAESLRLEVSDANLRGAPATYPAGIRKRYLELPASIPERVLALARNLTATAATPYDRALAIEAYLRRFPYFLEAPPPPPRRDAVDYFIFDLRKGYCDYYATAMVVLSRAAGLPARFVTGYSSGSYDPESVSYKVTEANAHSWAEIYFPGIGWVEFEPTASQPLPSRQGQGQPEALLPETTVRPESLAEQALIYVLRLRPGLLGIVAIVFVLLWVWTPAASMLLAHFRPEQAVGRFYRGIRRTARSLTGPLPVSQTAHEYAAALSLKLYQLEKQNPFGHWIVPAHDELGYLTDLYTSSLFTVNRPDRTQLAEAARAWIRLRGRLLLARIVFFLRRKPL